VVKSAAPKRVKELLEEYSRRFVTDFLASQPVPDKPSS